MLLTCRRHDTRVCRSGREPTRHKTTYYAKGLNSNRVLNRSHIANKTNSKKETQKIICNLLVSGSDGDLMFHKKGTLKSSPCLTRQVPKTWCKSNGDFHTKGKGSLEVKFFEYSNSKAVFLTPDIVEYDKKKHGKTSF